MHMASGNWQNRFCNTSPEIVLKTVFGRDSFRGLQAQAITCLMEGHNFLLLMPTGGGKSLCYQIPALCRRGMGLVISPLTALMDDQAASLNHLGIRAVALHSGLTEDDLATAQEEIVSGRIDILYLSPEKLLAPRTLSWLRQCHLSIIAIDEAHCISSWGHEFRPDYRRLSLLQEYFPDVPRIALTATADHKTCDDIRNILAIPEKFTLRSICYRGNIDLKIINEKIHTSQLISVLSDFKNMTGIIYCKNRARTARIAHDLKLKNLPALAYHAGLSPLEKRAALLRFRSGEALIIVATIAFGMGIDRPDIRFIIHLDMPSSPEAYYQQTGRAGRDGKKASALLFYKKNDIKHAAYGIQISRLSENEKNKAMYRLAAMQKIAETSSCRTQTLLHYLGEDFPHPCGHCDNCTFLKKIYHKIKRLMHFSIYSVSADDFTSDLLTDNEPFFEILRQWRANEAREQEVPAHVIFSDHELRLIASAAPRSLTELKQIRGVEPSRLSRYGRALTALITSDKMA
ncbi:RecQ family ATP-dependent DNA helicase [Acetobacter thailandicus]|uniref:RecQ family ATP-dependent DNA helicase n=1 Tax=Acetobacter thailandicus TaxID=1502842 RepID=UPI001FD1F286|nr:ATP-dependent DNA helicase RecQ [Acetobacter thailandicus]